MSIRGGIITQPKLSELGLQAVILNADGTVKKDLGTVAYYNRSKWKTLKWYLANPKQLRHYIVSTCKRLIWSSR